MPSHATPKQAFSARFNLKPRGALSSMSSLTLITLATFSTLTFTQANAAELASVAAIELPHSTVAPIVIEDTTLLVNPANPGPPMYRNKPFTKAEAQAIQQLEKSTPLKASLFLSIPKEFKEKREKVAMPPVSLNDAPEAAPHPIKRINITELQEKAYQQQISQQKNLNEATDTPVALVSAPSTEISPGVRRVNISELQAQAYQLSHQRTQPSFFSQPVLFVESLAFADSATTAVGLAGGAVEQNGLVNTSPAGLATLFIFKSGLTYYINKQEPETRAKGLKTMSALWGGVSVNNLFVIAGAHPPVAILGGILGGIGSYMYQSRLLEKEKKHKD